MLTMHLSLARDHDLAREARTPARLMRHEVKLSQRVPLQSTGTAPGPLSLLYRRAARHWAYRGLSRLAR